MNYFLAPIGRFFYSLIFILASFGNFSLEQIQFAATMGVPFPAILVPLSGVIALFGGLSILLGYKARFGAWLIIIFLLPVTFMMHKFWGLADPIVAKMQMIHFMKNLSMLGGAFLIAYFGAGPLSIDNKRA